MNVFVKQDEQSKTCFVLPLRENDCCKRTVFAKTLFCVLDVATLWFGCKNMKNFMPTVLRHDYGQV